MATTATDAPPAQAPTVLVGPSRVRWGAFAVLIGVFGAVATGKAIATGEAGGAVIGLVVCVAAFGVCARLVMTRRSLLVFDDYGFTDCRSGRAVPWEAVESIRANTHHGPFGSGHSLYLVLRRRPGQPAERQLIATVGGAEGEIAVALGGLALTPENLVASVERRSGLPVLRTQTSGFADPRSR